MSAEHSPLPWTLEIWVSENFASIHTPNGLEFGEIQSTDAHAMRAADAAFIVKAVNSYAVMVNALTQAEQAFSPLVGFNEEGAEAMASIRAALAIAKGAA